MTKFGKQVAILVRLERAVSVSRHAWDVTQGSIGVRLRRTETRRRRRRGWRILGKSDRYGCKCDTKNADSETWMTGNSQGATSQSEEATQLSPLRNNSGARGVTGIMRGNLHSESVHPMHIVCYAVSWLTLVGAAYACSCIPVTASELMRHADVVFLGTIIDLHDVHTAVPGVLRTNKRVVVFRVSRVWKGDLGQVIELPAIEQSGSMCIGFPTGLLSVGNELLVYANREPVTHDYVTSICSHTALAKQTRDLQELGQGKLPRKRN